MSAQTTAREEGTEGGNMTRSSGGLTEKEVDDRGEKGKKKGWRRYHLTSLSLWLDLSLL